MSNWCRSLIEILVWEEVYQSTICSKNLQRWWSHCKNSQEGISNPQNCSTQNRQDRMTRTLPHADSTTMEQLQLHQTMLSIICYIYNPSPWTWESHFVLSFIQGVSLGLVCVDCLTFTCTGKSRIWFLYISSLLLLCLCILYSFRSCIKLQAWTNLGSTLLVSEFVAWASTVSSKIQESTWKVFREFTVQFFHMFRRATWFSAL